MESIKKVFKNPMFYVALIYLLFPADILPDAVPIIGTLDDLVPFIVSLIVQNKIK